MSNPHQQPTDESKQCGHCKKWFTIDTGKWINQWFYVTCPHCNGTNKTQTPWFELRAVHNKENENAIS